LQITLREFGIDHGKWCMGDSESDAILLSVLSQFTKTMIGWTNAKLKEIKKPDNWSDKLFRLGLDNIQVVQVRCQNVLV